MLLQPTQIILHSVALPVHFLLSHMLNDVIVMCIWLHPIHHAFPIGCLQSGNVRSHVVRLIKCLLVFLMGDLIDRDMGLGYPLLIVYLRQVILVRNPVH